jgi:hypothetical protein
MHFVVEDSLLGAFLKCTELVVKNGVRKSDMAEIQDLLCKVILTDQDVSEFRDFVHGLEDNPILKGGREKAQRAYKRLSSSITKPSYIGRMRDYQFFKAGANDWDPIDQFEIISDQFETAPQSSNLGMIIFHPNDISDAFRPGYVPCLSFVDVKFRNGNLATKFYFRSCDFAEVGLFDFYHCLDVHREIVGRFNRKRPDVDITEQSILWNFSRAFTYNRRRGPIEFIQQAALELQLQ